MLDLIVFFCDHLWLTCPKQIIRIYESSCSPIHQIYLCTQVCNVHSHVLWTNVNPPFPSTRTSISKCCFGRLWFVQNSWPHCCCEPGCEPSHVLLTIFSRILMILLWVGYVQCTLPVSVVEWLPYAILIMSYQVDGYCVLVEFSFQLPFVQIEPV